MNDIPRKEGVNELNDESLNDVSGGGYFNIKDPKGNEVEVYFLTEKRCKNWCEKNGYTFVRKIPLFG